MNRIATIAFGLLLFTGVLITAPGAALANDVAYMRGATAPWSENTNEAAMDQIFGADNWDDLRMADGAGPFLAGSGYRFVFLEGGDVTAIELNDYLQANGAAIEAFVNGGGNLLLNSAPNQGGNIDFGFGGVELVSSAFSNAGTAADEDHPVFQGPETPVATTISGTFFGHAILGNGISPIIIGATGDDQEGETILGELNFGSGLVLFGGMATNNFHSPSVEAANLRANIIAYAAEGSQARQAIPVPIFGPSGLLILVLLMAALGVWAIRRKPQQLAG